MAGVQRKLTAIFAADVHQFSKMMGEDEAGTLAALRACRSIVDGLIADHHGRVFGSAGDSVLAEFASAVSAVLCAVECQRALALRNAQPSTRQMQLRIGVNIGDVMIEGDNLYGDGVNVAARLEAVAQPGAICISSKVYDEVRRKLSDISFVDGGAQKLKNIEDPVGVYHVALGGGARSPAPAASASTALPPIPDRPLIALSALRVISGDDEVRALANGLDESLAGGLGRNTALAVKAGDAAGADFHLKGSIQAAGKRVRLSFVLEEAASGTSVWTERYDRQLDDVFGLQDEIVLRIVAAIRIRVKQQIFERLRSTDNATLAVPQLLDKAAGIFVRSLDLGGEAVRTTRLAIERAPDNSMACAMLGFALFRVADYEVAALAVERGQEMLTTLDRAVALNPRSYFARAMKALVLQDVTGDMRAAHEQASEAVEHNANFIPGKAMLGIAEIHLGRIDEGMRRLQEAMAAGAEDASHSRHRRELALGHWLGGNVEEGVRVATRLWQETPDMKRNALVLAGLLAAAGDLGGARHHVAALKKEAPGLALANARLPRFGHADAGARFSELLKSAGL
jgi:class 3 adenylate cyclase/TolB-like protein